MAPGEAHRVLKPQIQEDTQPSAQPLVLYNVVHSGDLAIVGKWSTGRVFRSECVDVTRGKQLHYPVDILTWFGWLLLSPHYVSLVFNIALVRS